MNNPEIEQIKKLTFYDKLLEVEKTSLVALIEIILEQREKKLIEKVDKILTIDVNPSNDDQREWYRGLGREEAQREMRDKALSIIKKQ